MTKRKQPDQLVQNIVMQPGAMYAGIPNRQANEEAIHQLMRAMWLGQSTQADLNRQTAAAMAQLLAFEPRDVIEGQIACQAIAVNNAVMECHRRAMLPNQTFEGRRESLNQANRLSRTYATLIETLNRHRGKAAQQRVTVEHVHVHQGGQAIVGAVSGGRGSSLEIKGQPHEPQPRYLANDGCVALLGDLQADEEAMPSARRPRT